MLGWLTNIASYLLCLVQKFAFWVATGLIDGVNALIVGIGAAIAAIVTHLPDMPAWPSEFAGYNFAWLNWLAPVSSLVALAGSGITLLLGFYAYKIALSWLRAI